LSGLVQLRFSKEITACAIKDLFAAITPLGTALYAGHGYFSFLRYVLRGWRQVGKPLHSLNSSLNFSSCERISHLTGAIFVLGPVPLDNSKELPHHRCSGVRNHARYLLEVAVRDKHHFAELAFYLRGL
jgi:hypothetical protein